MIVVTGASGQLGSLTLSELRSHGLAVEGRSRQPSEGVRSLDFDNPDTLRFAGVSTLVLISAGYAEDDQVIGRHQAVIHAARRDGVEHVVYTSLTGAGDHLGLAPGAPRHRTDHPRQRAGLDDPAQWPLRRALRRTAHLERPGARIRVR